MKYISYVIFVFYFILIFICSCSQPTKIQYTNVPISGQNIEVINIWIDKNFTPKELNQIKFAIQEWNYTLNKWIVLNIKSTTFDMEVADLVENIETDWFILKIDKNNLLIPTTNKSSYVLAFADKVGGNLIYVVHDRLRLEDYKPIMLHEIGHLMGAVHGEKYLMHPNYTINNYACIDQYTMDQVMKYRNIPFSVNYCKRTD